MKIFPLSEKGGNKWLAMGNDLNRPVNVADTNQVFLISGGEVTLIDPGSIEIFPTVLSYLSSSISISSIKNIIFTSSDPQTASSLPLWRQVCSNELQIWVPELQEDILSHLDAGSQFLLIPEQGIDLLLNSALTVSLIPAHHLHAPAAYTVFEPRSGIVYSGSIGSSSQAISSEGEFFINDFEGHLPLLSSYHKRWFASQLARDRWLEKIENLEINMLIPQRGPGFANANTKLFLDWFKGLDFGSPLSSNFADLKLAADTGSGNSQQRLVDISVNNQTQDRYRLVTRSDFDGIVCAVIFEELEMIDDILFAHPNDMQEGRVPITKRDIIANLPYVSGCHLAFDHHSSEEVRIKQKYDNYINTSNALSSARVVFDYYGGKRNLSGISDQLMEAVDQSDSAQYGMDEVINPEKWTLLSFVMDPRSGLGRFKGFRIPNYEMMMGLVEYCRYYSIEEILELPDIKERADFLLKEQVNFENQLKLCSKVRKNLIVLDLMNEKILHAGNRFLIYA